jgi:hypothetical protein
MAKRWGRSKVFVVRHVAVVTVASVVLVGAGMAPASAGAHPRPSGAEGIGTLEGSLTDPSPDFAGYGYAIDVSGDTAIVSALFHMVPDGSGGFYEDPGSTFIYTRHGATFAKEPSVTFNPPTSGDGQFGTDVAISGPTAAVSDPGQSGSVYLYTKTSHGWPTTPTVTLTDPQTNAPQGFGTLIALSGDTLMVAAYQDGLAGLVYVYTKGPSGWPTTPTTTLADPGASVNPPGNDSFGEELSLSGRTALVGAYGQYGDFKPVAYIYTERGTQWPTSPTVTLADPPSDNDEFGGISTALSGTTALVGGSKGQANGGYAYVFTRTRGGWPTVPGATFQSPFRGANDLFANSGMAVSGNVAVVGDTNAHLEAGAAYVYMKGDTGLWQTSPTIVLNDPLATAGEDFGSAIAVSGSTLLIGAAEGGSTASFAPGLIYVYKI